MIFKAIAKCIIIYFFLVQDYYNLLLHISDSTLFINIFN